MKQQVNVLIAGGGAGDLICSMVAVDFNLRNYQNVEFLIWTPDYLLDFAKHVLPKGSIVRNFTEAHKKYNPALQGVTTKWEDSFHTSMRTHPVDYAFHKISDIHLYDLNQKNYLKIRPKEVNLFKYHLPEKYVVLCCSAAVKVKEMPSETMSQLIDYVISKGYTPVFLGKSHSSVGVRDLAIKADFVEVDYSKGLDLRDKTSLLEAGAIMSGAKAVVGTDGGLVHLAGCTDSYIVCGYTLASPVHLAPIRNGSQTYKFFAVEPDEDIPNRYYQTNNNFNYDEDMRFFKGWEQVRESMTFNKFKNVLEKIL